MKTRWYWTIFDHLKEIRVDRIWNDGILRECFLEERIPKEFVSYQEKE